MHSTDFIAYSRRRRGNETLLRGDREEGFLGGVLLSRGVLLRRDATFMSHVHPLLEAEDMPVDFLPRDALPGHLQRASLRFGTVPLTPPFTFHDPGPTSAYPGHYPGPWLLRASSSRVAYGWHLLQKVTSFSEGHAGLLRSQLPLLASLGRCSPPGFEAVQAGQYRGLPGPYPASV